MRRHNLYPEVLVSCQMLAEAGQEITAKNVVTIVNGTRDQINKTLAYAVTKGKLKRQAVGSYIIPGVVCVPSKEKVKPKPTESKQSLGEFLDNVHLIIAENKRLQAKVKSLTDELQSLYRQFNSVIQEASQLRGAIMAQKTKQQMEEYE